MKAYYNHDGGYVVSFSNDFELDFPHVDVSDIDSVLDNLNRGRIAKVVDGQIVFESDKALLMSNIRTERQSLLEEADAERNKIYDIALISSTPADQAALKELAIYRQALRDIVETCDPENVVWPQKPWLTL